MVVMGGVAHRALGQRNGWRVAAGLGVLQLQRGLVGRNAARAAVHHHGAFNALRGLAHIGFEHFQLKTDATRFAAEHEFRVDKGQAIGVGLQWPDGIDGVVVQFSPDIGQAAFIELGVGFHGVPGVANKIHALKLCKNNLRARVAGWREILR